VWRDGLRVLSFAVHSPSAEPGHTPYVRSTRELTELLGRCRSLFDLLLGKLGGRPSTPLAVKRELQVTFRAAPAEV